MARSTRYPCRPVAPAEPRGLAGKAAANEHSGAHAYCFACAAKARDLIRKGVQRQQCFLIEGSPRCRYVAPHAGPDVRHFKNVCLRYS